MILLIKKNAQFLLLLLFSIFNLTVYGQDSGILIKSTMYPFKGWVGSHGGHHIITVGSNKVDKRENRTNENVIIYDFMYISDNEYPDLINCRGFTYGNNSGDCNVGDSDEYPINIPYNKLNFNEGYFEGCIGESDIYGIHINQLDTQPKCIEDLISLQYGWNWEYQYNSDGWKSFPIEFQENRKITFKIKDLGGYEGKTNIKFRTGYKTQFTNIITYSIIGCSPELAVNPPLTGATKCKGTASGSVTLEFKTPLKDGDKFLFNIFKKTSTSEDFDRHLFVIKDSIKNNKYTWKGLAEGNYIIKYQAQSNIATNTEVGSSAIITSAFIIGSQPQLTFTAVATQPKCNTESGSILVTAQGGTSQYKYSRVLNGSTIESNVAFDSSVIINPLVAGSHTIYVSDAYNCVIAPQSKEINQAPPAITITGTPEDVTVNGGTDGAINDFLISNATTTFKSEIWRNGGTDITKPTNLTALSAGVYTVSIVDQNGCTSPTNPTPFTINQPDVLSVTIEEPSRIACNGDTGTLIATPSGGFPYGTNVTRNYTYEWYKCDNILGANTSLIPSEATNQITNRKAGFYKVIVSDYKTKSEPFIIELKQNPQIIVSEKAITNVKCLGNKGSVTLAITGGTGDYTIAWLDNSYPTQNIITSTPDKNNNVFHSTINEIGGKYYYTITDATVPECSISGNITIKEPEADLIITSIKKQPLPLNPTDGEIKITPIGGTFPNETINYTYQWSKLNDLTFSKGNINEIKGLSNGAYQVVVTSSSGCVAPTETIKLETLNVKIQDSEVKCFGDTDGSLTAIASGGTLKNTDSKYTFTWKKIVNNIEVDINSNSIVSNDPTTIINLSKGTYRVTIKDDDLNTTSDDSFLTQPDKQLTVTNDITTQQHQVSCYGQSNGAIEITVDGGTFPYTYSWSDNSIDKNSKDRSKLSVGTYSVLVTDSKGCIAELKDIKITSPTDIDIPTPNIKKVSIFGKGLSDGAITIAPITGGLVGNETSTTYTYSWTKDNDATVISTIISPTGLGKGTYHLTVTANNTNCTKTIDCVVPENDELTVAIQETTSIFCYGTATGKLHAEIKGGFGLYKIAWYKKNEQTSTLDFISNLQDIDSQSSGEYSVKITDSANPEPTGPFAEAEQLDYKLINQKTLLTVDATAQTNVLCHGAQTGAISIQIEGGTSPYTAVWSNGNTPLPARTNLGKLDTIPDLFSGTYSVIITDAYGCTASLANPLIISQPLAPLLITDLEVKNLTGFETLNGRISVAITGGTAPYTYAWRNKGITTIIGDKAQISSLPIGTYELTITDDHNCIVTKDYILKQPDKLLITAISQTPTSIIKCNGDKFGILEATVTGGAPIGVLDANKNYTYKWYNVLTPNVTASTTNPSETLVAGTYALTVTDVENNTFTLQSAPIVEPPLLKIDYSQTNVSCYDGNNGTITITVTGGTGNHTIRWSNGKDTEVINNLREGIYTVTVTDDNQCQTIENITITEPGLLYVSKVTKNPPTALGLKDGSIEIQVTGGTPNYNYLWYNDKKELIYSDLNQPSNTSINNIFAGQYFITVTDAKGCAIIEKDLDKIDPLVLSINQINVVKCNGDATASIKAAASGGTPIYYYKWYKTTDPLNAIGQAATLVNATAGTYYFVLLDSFGMTKQSENITITEPDILNNTLASEYTRCGDANDWTITTTPTGGTAPYTYLWNTGARTANLQDVPPANYSVLITDNHGCTITKNITIIAPIHLATAEVITKPTCFEGSDATIVLTSSGGQGPYTYLWNTGEQSNVLSNASAKVYSVAVTDFKGCVINKTYTIENPPKDVINLGEDVTLCFDQSLTINATIDDDKAKYSWTSTKGYTSNKPIITVSEPAQYTLVVTNRLGCNATDMLKISKQDTAISAEFAASSQVFMNEKFIIVDISNPIADSIEWILPLEATIVSKNKDFAELSFSKVGEYELTLNTKKGNCTATQTKKIVVVEGEYTDPDSTDLKKKFDLKTYPNPSNGIFTVDVTLDKVMSAHIKVYSLTNNVIIDSKYEEGKDNYSFNFSLSGLTAGVYFVLVESQQGNQLRKIIIK